MDLGLYARVIWRFRLIVFLGLLLAIVLSLLSFVQLSFKHGTPSVTYRQAETWQSATRLLLGGRGFPQGSAVSRIPDPSTATTSSVDFGGLAVYYKLLANGDVVQGILKRDKSLQGTMVASQYVDSSIDSLLPILLISGLARTPDMATRVAHRGADVFRSYLKSRQVQERIPANKRVKLTVLNAAAGAVLINPRRKTLPIVIFLTAMIATIGLAFILENLRPRVHLVARDVDLPARSDRRSA
ncbi:MAG: hypothetical protein M3T56_11040 [Chloroflexota bacterium]|nr:hypothetical protein [Chloroflexota bacterium]